MAQGRGHVQSATAELPSAPAHLVSRAASASASSVPNAARGAGSRPAQAAAKSVNSRAPSHAKAAASSSVPRRSTSRLCVAATCDRTARLVVESRRIARGAGASCNRSRSCDCLRATKGAAAQRARCIALQPRVACGCPVRPRRRLCAAPMGPARPVARGPLTTAAVELQAGGLSERAEAPGSRSPAPRRRAGAAAPAPGACAQVAEPRLSVWAGRTGACRPAYARRGAA